MEGLECRETGRTKGRKEERKEERKNKRKNKKKSTKQKKKNAQSTVSQFFFCEIGGVGWVEKHKIASYPSSMCRPTISSLAPFFSRYSTL